MHLCIIVTNFDAFALYSNQIQQVPFHKTVPTQTFPLPNPVNLPIIYYFYICKKTVPSKMKRINLRTACLLVLSQLIISHLYSQHQVSGTITDDTGEALIGVNVLIKDSTGGTVTDYDGTYTINAPSTESVLIFSYIGFSEQEVAIAGRNKIDLTLSESSEQLEEIVVTAFGIERQKRALGYATEKLDGSEISVSNAPNVLSALGGKMAGVNITQSSGVEGGTTRIVIRGNNNISGNNQPLIIVDGVPLENDPGFSESEDNRDISSGKDWGSAINNINPADIESMDVLKGANAAALYGARGKNGVILITLKKGKARKGIGVDYSFGYRSIEPFRFRDVQNVYGAGGPISESTPTFQLNDDGEPTHPSQIYSDIGPGGVPTTQSFGFYGGAQSWGPEMDGTMIRWWDGEMRPFDPQPDNIKLFYDNGFTSNHNVAFSGGGDNGTIRVSFTRTDHQAITPNSNFNQNTVNIGGVLNVTERLKTTVSANYINFNRLNTPGLANDANNNFESGMVYSFPRSYKGLNFDYQNADGTRKQQNGWPYFYVSPYQIWNAYNHNTTLGRDKWLGSIGLTYDITDWLSFTARTGIDNTHDDIETRRNPIDRTGTIIDDGTGGFYNIPVGYEHSLSTEKVLNNEFLFTIKKDKLFTDDINASLRLGGNQWRRERYQLGGVGARQWRDPVLYNFGNYTFESPLTENDLPSLNESFYNKRINSLFGFLDVNYRNMLFLQVTGRNDWSSTLPLDNNSYFYPSANISFVLTEAVREQIPQWVSHLKVRAAASQTATDDEPYQLNNIYNTSTFNGNATGSLPSNIPPIDLRPQRAFSWETGLEVGIWDDRVTADITYYYIHSYDQLLRSPVPASSGFDFIKINTGEMDNKGIEAIITARFIQKQNFSWQTGLTFAKNNNRLLKLNDGAETLELAGIWGSNGPSISVKAGEPYGIITGFDYVRDEATGMPLLSEDGKFFQVTDTQVPIKIYDDNGNFLRFANATPKFTGGWNNSITFGNFSLSTLIDVKWGGDMWFGSYAVGLQSGQSPETLDERQGGGLAFEDPSGETRNVGVVLNGVHENGQINDAVVHYYYKYLNQGGWGRVLTTPAVQENSWIKMREIILRYDIPQKLVNRTKVFQQLSVAFSGRDLFFIYDTAPDNINPEGSIGAGNAQGLEFASLPGTRTFGVTLNASF